MLRFEISCRGRQVLPNGWILWEEGKYVSVSRRRFRSIQSTPTGLRVTVSGAAGEVVRLVALRPLATATRPRSSTADGGAASMEWTVVSRHVTMSARAGTSSVWIE